MSIDQPIHKSNLGQSNVLDKEIDTKRIPFLKGGPKGLDQSHSIGDKFCEEKTHCRISKMQFEED